eukprot:scaffold1541_cov256-Pinguiococcus_pyrenoidosus.AAC.3
MWLDDPFPRFKGDYDIWGQVHVKTRTEGSFDDPEALVNPGFMAVRSNERTIAVMQKWTDLMQDGPTHNMGKFNDALAAVPGVKVFRLKGDFPEGNMMDWTEEWIKQSKPVVVHNNWVGRKDSKKNRFVKSGLWPCDPKTCDDPTMVARRRLYEIATQEMGAKRKEMSASSLWLALVQNPELAKAAGFATRPLKGREPPEPFPAKHPKERSLDRLLRLLGSSGSMSLPVKGYMEIFYH